MLIGLAVAMAPVPALAGPPAQPPSAPGVSLVASIDKAALTERLVPSAPAASRASSAQGGDVDLGSPSFFKTRTGIAVLAVFAAGVGYALYSTQHDRIKSPAKQ